MTTDSTREIPPAKAGDVAAVPATELVTEFELARILKELGANAAERDMVQLARQALATRAGGESLLPSVSTEDTGSHAVYRLKDIKAAIAEIYQTPGQAPKIAQARLIQLLDGVQHKIAAKTTRMNDWNKALQQRLDGWLQPETEDKAGIPLPKHLQKNAFEKTGEKLGGALRQIFGFTRKAVNFTLDLAIIGVCSPWLALRTLNRKSTNYQHQNSWHVDKKSGHIYCISDYGRRGYFIIRNFLGKENEFRNIEHAQQSMPSLVLVPLRLPSPLVPLIAGIAIYSGLFTGVRSHANAQHQAFVKTPAYAQQQLAATNSQLAEIDGKITAIKGDSIAETEYLESYQLASSQLEKQQQAIEAEAKARGLDISGWQDLEAMSEQTSQAKTTLDKLIGEGADSTKIQAQQAKISQLADARALAVIYSDNHDLLQLYKVTAEEAKHDVASNGQQMRDAQAQRDALQRQAQQWQQKLTP